MKRIKKPPCKFGQILLELMNKKGLNPYDVERKSGNISATSINRFITCMRFPSPFKNNTKTFSVIELAKLIGLSKEEKAKIYKALVETFYGDLVEYFKSINDKKITSSYIKSLINKKPAGKTWTEIYRKIPEPTALKIRRLDMSISLLNTRDSLKDFLNELNLTDEQRAEVLYFFLKRKGADEEFLELIRT